MKKLLVLGIVFLTACGANPISSEDTGNADVSAGLIATVDGCKIFRVKDGNDRKIYFAKCEHSEITSWNQSCGKGCVENKSVNTYEK